MNRRQLLQTAIGLPLIGKTLESLLSAPVERPVLSGKLDPESETQWRTWDVDPPGRGMVVTSGVASADCNAGDLVQFSGKGELSVSPVEFPGGPAVGYLCGISLEAASKGDPVNVRIQGIVKFPRG